MMTIVNCPTWGRGVEGKTENQFRPFCSERCKQIDFGAWAIGKYKISGSDQLADHP
ncbi:DNA gyrase inhibitor YacG [Candidatus Vallotia lariciata]|uniref:DNA gyrase inhibitor YacG n=1 Tax=Candidatus Vallotia laricis TaxID=2018052 RepID=UPI001D028884|nr:DNA gyrase inhibitor YacG [Candidatus Vallotia lariciata]